MLSPRPIIQVELQHKGKKISIEDGVHMGQAFEKSIQDLTDGLSGMLCKYHQVPPTITRVYEDDCWQLEIKTCCMELMKPAIQRFKAISAAQYDV
jgi:hypothetical protein